MKKVISEGQEQQKAARRNGGANGHVSVSLKTPEERATLVQITEPVDNALRVSEFVGKETQIGLPMQCDNCYVQDRCKFVKEGSSCYFRLENQFETPGDLVKALRVMMIAQMNRVTQALYQEQLDGGVLDRNLSFELERLNSMVYGFKDFLKPSEEEASIKVKGPGAVSAILAALGPRVRKPKTTVLDTAPTA